MKLTKQQTRAMETALDSLRREQSRLVSEIRRLEAAVDTAGDRLADWVPASIMEYRAKLAETVVSLDVLGKLPYVEE